jgi:hypothetical protein
MKNSKQLCREVAKQLDLPESHVREEYLFIMSHLKRALIGMGGAVMLHKVGSFNVNYPRLCKEITRLIKKVRYFSNPPAKTMLTENKRQLIETAYRKSLKRLLEERNIQAIQRQRLKKYYAERRILKAAKRLAKQAQNAAAGNQAGKDKASAPLTAHESKGPAVSKEVRLDQ